MGASPLPDRKLSFNDPTTEVSQPFQARRHSPRKIADNKGNERVQEFNYRIDRHERNFGERVSTRHTRNPPPVRDHFVELPLHQRKGREDIGKQIGYSSPPPPPLTLKGEDTTQEQEVNSPVTYLRRQAVESNLQQENGEIAVIGNQSQTREQILQDIDKATQLYLSCDDPTEAAARRLRVLAGDASGQVEETVTTMLAGSDPQADDSHKTHPLGTSSQVQSRDLIMEELQNVTLQYLSCADPAEAAARRLRVLAGDAQGQMEEVAADILAANTPQAAAGIGMVEQRDVIVTPIRDNDQTKTTQNDQPQEELMQRSESDGDIPPRRRRIVPARFRSPTVSSSILRGASSKKRNLTGKMNSPARRNNGRHPSAHVS
ncbi:hypothetical protein YC2023_054974 [Brassica napus]